MPFLKRNIKKADALRKSIELNKGRDNLIRDVAAKKKKLVMKR